MAFTGEKKGKAKTKGGIPVDYIFPARICGNLSWLSTVNVPVDKKEIGRGG